MLVAEVTEDVEQGERVGLGGEPVGEVRERRLGDELDEAIAVLDALVERGGADADAIGDGLHRDAREPVALEQVARGDHDGVEGRSLRCGHIAIIAIDHSHDGYVS